MHICLPTLTFLSVSFSQLRNRDRATISINGRIHENLRFNFIRNVPQRTAGHFC